MISVVRRAFEFGYRDHPEHHNPAAHLRRARLTKKDRPKIDPFAVQDAETLIAAIHRDWGEAQGNYDATRIGDALWNGAWADVDWDNKTLYIGKTKNGEPVLTPLSRAAIARLKMIPKLQDNPFIICGAISGKPLAYLA